MLVSDIMTLDPNCCTPECSAHEAALRMREHSTGVLPVVAKPAGKLVGIVTDRDLCIRVIAEGGSPRELLVRDCMTPDVLCCAAGEPVERALDVMRQNHVRRLPVVDSAARVLGIISLSDIIRYAALPEAEVMAAVAHICEPVGTIRLRREPVGIETIP